MKSHEKCRQCFYSAPPEERNQVFKDGRIHLRLNCVRCGAFIKYGASVNAKTIREECYDLVKNLALVDLQFPHPHIDLLVSQARHIMDRIHKPLTRAPDPEQVEMPVE